LQLRCSCWTGVEEVLVRVWLFRAGGCTGVACLTSGFRACFLLLWIARFTEHSSSSPWVMLMYTFAGSPLHNILQSGVSFIGNVSHTPIVDTVDLQEVYDTLESCFLGRNRAHGGRCGKHKKMERPCRGSWPGQEHA